MPPKKERASPQEDANSAPSASLAKPTSPSLSGLPPALFQSSFALLFNLCFQLVPVLRLRQEFHQLNVEPFPSTLRKVLSISTPLFPSLYFTVALLLYHVLRLLSPQFIWCHPAAPTPLEDLRLALAHPLAFLEDHVAGSGHGKAWPELCKWLIDLAASILAHDLTKSGTRSPNHGFRSQITEATSQRRQQRRRIEECMREAAHITYLMYAFSCMEYAFDRSMNTVTIVIALWKALSGPAAEQLALWPILAVHRGSLAFCAWYLGQFISQALAPTLHVAMVRAWSGRPAMLSLLLAGTGGIVATLKYRSKLIIALEMSDLFVIVGLAIGGAIELATHAARQPWTAEHSKIATF
jgi:hypothetical protein